MSDWIELKYLKDNTINKCAVRSYAIAEIEAIGSSSCKVFMEDHDHHWTIAEPYEEVMKKIKEAEGPVAVPVAEHFTREEYQALFDIVTQHSDPDHNISEVMLNRLANTIKMILKEDE